MDISLILIIFFIGLDIGFFVGFIRAMTYYKKKYKRE